jgi:DNA-binding CsgD family transcriptional regulator
MVIADTVRGNYRKYTNPLAVRSTTGRASIGIGGCVSGAMTSHTRLRLKDLRAAYRLIGECRELGHDVSAWRLHMLDGLRKLVGAQVGMHVQFDAFGTPDERVIAPLDAGFLDASDRALWVHYKRENDHRKDLFRLRYYAGFTGALRTRSLDSVIDAREWYSSRDYNEYVGACGLDDRITSSLRLPQHPGAPVQTIVLLRAKADGKYCRRAVRLVHLFHHELAPLLGRQLALPDTSDGTPPLPARLQQVLACLLQGDGEKQVAARLGLSQHTVNRHVQRLYRRYAVRSRGELMFRCRNLLTSLPVPD